MSKDRTNQVQELYESWTRAELSFRLNIIPKLKGTDIGLSQIEVLFALSHCADNKASVKELVEITHKSSSAITQLVETLENEGYVERKRSTEDRRVVHVHLTKRGNQTFGVFYASLLESIGGMTNILSDEEMAEYIKLNNKIAGHIIGKSK